MCMSGLCGGIALLFFVSSISKAVKGVFRILQYEVPFVYQAVLGIVSNHNRCVGLPKSYAFSRARFKRNLIWMIKFFFLLKTFRY